MSEVATTFGAAVAGLGVALPQSVVASETLAAELGVETDWIVGRTGIRQRHVAGPDERLSDLAAAAGRGALADARIYPGDVDLVLVGTVTADELMPAAAPQVAHAIGAGGAGAVDIAAACSGFVSGLTLAVGALESGRASVVLLVGADFMTRITDPDDRTTAPLFADGAAAVVLTRTEAPGTVGAMTIGSDGAGAALLQTPRSTGTTVMNGHEVFKHAVRRMVEVTRQTCEAAGVTLDEVDLFVYHQANRRILSSVATRLGLTDDRIVDCVGAYGNTSAASIPLALAYARADGRLRQSARVLLASFGAGFTWGGAMLEWTLPR